MHAAIPSVHLTADVSAGDTMLVGIAECSDPWLMLLFDSFWALDLALDSRFVISTGWIMDVSTISDGAGSHHRLWHGNTAGDDI